MPIPIPINHFSLPSVHHYVSFYHPSPEDVYGTYAYELSYVAIARALHISQIKSKFMSADVADCFENCQQMVTWKAGRQKSSKALRMTMASTIASPMRRQLKPSFT